MRKVARAAGISPMAIYNHFPDRDTLLRGATEAENIRIAAYFRRAHCRAGSNGLDGMLGYLDYALDHPRLFEYMFSSQREDAAAFPGQLSLCLQLLHKAVEKAMHEEGLKQDDSMAVLLAIWAHAHGLVALFLAGRIRLSKAKFRELYVKSLDRLLHGLAKAHA